MFYDYQILEITDDVYGCAIHTKYQPTRLKEKNDQTLGQSLIGQGCEHVMVKLHPNKHYEVARKFYKSVGFKDFYTNDKIWDQENPCLIMVKNIRDIGLAVVTVRPILC